MNERARRSAGFTFVEVSIGAAVLIVIMVVVYMVLLRSSSHAATQATVGDLDAQCRQILADVTRDIREADNVQFDPANTVLVGPLAGQVGVSTRLTLTKVAGFNPYAAATGAVTYSVDGSVVWENLPLEGAPNGVDNDGDGMIDQCAVRRTDGTGARNLTTRGTARVGTTWPVLTPGVLEMVPRWPVNQRPPALYFAFSTWDPDGTGPDLPEVRPLIHVVVTLQGVDSRGRPLMRSLTAKVTLRNSVRPPAP